MIVERPRAIPHPFDNAFETFSLDLLTDIAVHCAQSKGMDPERLATLERITSDTHRARISELKGAEIALFNTFIEFAKGQEEPEQVSQLLRLIGLTKEQAGRVEASIRIYRSEMGVSDRM